MNSVALGEMLDALDPLRHLREDTNDELVPPQIPTVINQTIELAFPPLKHTVKLMVDASPGTLSTSPVQCNESLMIVAHRLWRSSMACGRGRLLC
jgi:hypothetical protein